MSFVCQHGPEIVVWVVNTLATAGVGYVVEDLIDYVRGSVVDTSRHCDEPADIFVALNGEMRVGGSQRRHASLPEALVDEQSLPTHVWLREAVCGTLDERNGVLVVDGITQTALPTWVVHSLAAVAEVRGQSLRLEFPNELSPAD